MDLTDKIVKDTTQEHLERFFADKDLSYIVQSALESYVNHPAWMFDQASLALSNEQYGEQMKTRVFAAELVKSAFAGLRLAAQKKAPLQPVNEAR